MLTFNIYIKILNYKLAKIPHFWNIKHSDLGSDLISESLTYYNNEVVFIGFYGVWNVKILYGGKKGIVSPISLNLTEIQ